MRKLPCFPLFLLTLLVLTAGCQSAHTARAKQRYRETDGSFTDLAARSAYIDQRVAELTDKGVTRDDAAARASREWFSSAPVASQTPTAYELKRRAAQAALVNYLDQQKDAGSR